MPPVFDVEYYARLKPSPGTGPGRFLAMHFAMAIRDQATRWTLGPKENPKLNGIASWIFVAGKGHELVPPTLQAATVTIRFLKQLVAGAGVLALQIGERSLDVHVEITPKQHADEIAITLPVSSALHGPAIRVLELVTTQTTEFQIKFLDEEFEDESSRRVSRYLFQLCSKLGGWRTYLLGRSRMPFHPDMHPPTKLLMVVLLLCLRDGAKELMISPGPEVVRIWYLVESEWHELSPAPDFVWPQLVRVIERHATLIRPESPRVDTPGVGWLELRWGQDLPPDNLAVFLDPRDDSSKIMIKFLRVLPPKPRTNEPAKPLEDADADDDMFTVEFSPDDE